MSKFSPRFGPLVSVLLAVIAMVPGRAAAQTVDASPAPAAVPLAEQSAQSLPAASVPPQSPALPDLKSRHLAPRDTFYLLTYVSARTDTGVEGFEPGQEVRFVEAHRATHTLVVTDGHAQVEVSPAQLTHDMDIAAMVRQKDQANQARIAAYVQAEHAAYEKYEREAADFTARDLALRRQEAAAATAATEQPAEPVQTPASEQAAPVDTAPTADDGYYGADGYGYGSPYVYFVTPRPTGRSSAPVAPAMPAPAGKIEAPVGKVEAGRPK